jgi:hypothetical protein
LYISKQAIENLQKVGWDVVKQKILFMCKIDEITLKNAGITTKPACNRGLQKKNIVVQCGYAKEVQKGKNWRLIIRLSNNTLREVISPNIAAAKTILQQLGIVTGAKESYVNSRYGRTALSA